MADMRLNQCLERIIAPQYLGRSMPSRPVVLSFESGNAALCLVGVRHSRKPGNAHYRLIAHKFEEFVRSHPKNDIVVLLEGCIPLTCTSRDEMIRSYGETGFIASLAREAGLAVVCPEPSPAQMVSFASKRGLRKGDIDAWITMNRAASGSLDIGLTIREKQMAFRLQDPFVKGTKLNLAGSLLNLSRDWSICQAALSSLFVGKSVFGVFGINHVLAQRPAYELFFRGMKKTPVRKRESVAD